MTTAITKIKQSKKAAPKPKTWPCRICRINRVPVGTHACAVCE